MKLKVFNQSNTMAIRTGEPTVRINTKSGGIAFNKDASLLLQINSESRIEFHQDEERPIDWYIEVSNSSDAFKVRTKDTGLSRESTVVQNTFLARLIVSGVNKELTSASFLIGKIPTDFEGKKLFPIITKSAK